MSPYQVSEAGQKIGRLDETLASEAERLADQDVFTLNTIRNYRAYAKWVDEGAPIHFGLNEYLINATCDQYEQIVKMFVVLRRAGEPILHIDEDRFRSIHIIDKIKKEVYGDWVVERPLVG